MRVRPGQLPRGFTLIELLVALLILSSLALMSYRGLGAVLDARTHVSEETGKWRRLAAFVARFEGDVKLAAPRPVRSAKGPAPAWRGIPDANSGPLVEFSRAAAVEGMERPRRLGYGLNDRLEIELWLWPGLDLGSGTVPERHAVLEGVAVFELQYLDLRLAWTDTWPATAAGQPIPRAVRMRIVLASGEEIMRIFALN